MAAMKLNSVWCLMVAFAEPVGAAFEARRRFGWAPPLPLSFYLLNASVKLADARDRPLPCSTLATPQQGAFVEGCPVLSWAANNTAKFLGNHPKAPASSPKTPSAAAPAGAGTDTRECWTLFSTASYGRANKVPQEMVPPDAAKRVTAEMLAAFEKALGALGLLLLSASD